MLTPFMLRTPRSRAGALRQYNAIIRSYKIDFSGGGTFGWDWPTFRVNSPERAERARELLLIAKDHVHRHNPHL